MSYTFTIRPEAEADLAEAKRWYEERRQGLGADFVLCVDEALERIRRILHARGRACHSKSDSRTTDP